jgi:hypothetical protein
VELSVLELHLSTDTIQSAVLKEFYCNLKLFSIHVIVLSQDGYIEAGCVWQFEGILFIVLSLLSITAILT